MSAKNWPAALKFTLQFEGGKVDLKSDPGGRTAFGVTQRTYTAWLAQNGKSNRSVYTITPAEVDTIYRRDFANKISFDSLPSGVDLIAFDIAVNMGVGRILPWLDQTAHLSPIARIRALDAKRLGFWRVLRIFRTFGAGWVRRENACRAEALKLV